MAGLVDMLKIASHKSTRQTKSSRRAAIPTDQPHGHQTIYKSTRPAISLPVWLQVLQTCCISTRSVTCLPDQLQVHQTSNKSASLAASPPDLLHIHQISHMSPRPATSPPDQHHVRPPHVHHTGHKSYRQKVLQTGH